MFIRSCAPHACDARIGMYVNSKLRAIQTVCVCVCVCVCVSLVLCAKGKVLIRIFATTTSHVRASCRDHNLLGIALIDIPPNKNTMASRLRPLLLALRLQRLKISLRHSLRATVPAPLRAPPARATAWSRLAFAPSCLASLKD